MPALLEPGEYVLPRSLAPVGLLVEQLARAAAPSRLTRRLMIETALGFRRMLTHTPYFAKGIDMAPTAGRGWQGAMQSGQSMTLNVNAAKPDEAFVRNVLVPELERFYRHGLVRPPWMRR